MHELNKIKSIKPDVQVIYDQIAPNTRVLDLGCGDGTLLKLLKENKHCSVQGIDRDQNQVMSCIANGVPVIQMNLDQGLSYFQDKSFDYVILGLTFQQIHRPHKLLHDMCRVGHNSLVSVFNLGYIKTRLQIFWTGIMPINKRLPYEWYDTPNIHLGTEKDFCNMCKKENIRITCTRRISIFPDTITNSLPNLFSEISIFNLQKPPSV